MVVTQMMGCRRPSYTCSCNQEPQPGPQAVTGSYNVPWSPLGATPLQLSSAIDVSRACSAFFYFWESWSVPTSLGHSRQLTLPRAMG